jgi:type II secretion system protein J
VNPKSDKNGFTLVEILVAVTLIVAIVSMVYGSYFATSRSTQLCQARMGQFQDMRRLLTLMARQVRGAYCDQQAHRVKVASGRGKVQLENAVDYFSGNGDDPSGRILHLLTTCSGSRFATPQNGLFELTYKLDKAVGLLSVGERRFAGPSDGAGQGPQWRPVAENVTSLELAFFDGEQWLKEWSFENKKELPAAVKINISSEDQAGRQYHDGTVAYVCCRSRQGQETELETPMAVETP